MHATTGTTGTIDDASARSSDLMPSSEIKVELSATEFPHFARLVQFLEDTEDYARVCADDDLEELAIDCRADLAKLSEAWRS